MEKAKKEKITIDAETRIIVGKKVQKLREQGKLPANVFGEDFKSQAITLDINDFRKTYKIAGETQVVYVHIDSNEYPTLIDTVQKHPISGQLLHVDFKKVSLKKKIETEVPLVFIGESEAVEKKKGDMLTFKDVLLVSALPDAIPANIEVDISALIDVDNEILLKDLPKSPDYEFIDELDTVIVRISAHKEESVEPDTTSEMPEITEETEQSSEESQGSQEEASSAEESSE